jgi:hypothetical protein
MPTSAPNCPVNTVVAPAGGWEITRYRKGDTEDIIETILYADAHSDEYIRPEGLDCLTGSDVYETLNNLWAFVKYNVRYRPDRPGHERVKSPGALFHEGVGDCKSFSIALGAMLSRLGIPYVYRFTSYEPGDFTHVYVVAYPRGYAGGVIIDSVHRKFDDEVRYYRKKDIRPATKRKISGLSAGAGEAAASRFPNGLADWLFLISLGIIGRKFFNR